MAEIYTYISLVRSISREMGKERKGLLLLLLFFFLLGRLLGKNLLVRDESSISQKLTGVFSYATLPAGKKKKKTKAFTFCMVSAELVR